MKQYTSNRVKNAAVIESIQTLHDGSATIWLDTGENFAITREYINKHEPEVGGYFIEYDDDGYLSFCPADVFARSHTES